MAALDRDAAADAFERLVAHLQRRTDVQNIDLMTLAGFCRNCLADWYREALAARGTAQLSKDEAREVIYGMPPAAWKARYQQDASAAQTEAFAKDKPSH